MKLQTRLVFARRFTRLVAVLITLVSVRAVFSADPQGSASLLSDPCKPAGRQCKTNMSCCSGRCVKPTVRRGKAVFGICCAPTTCQAAGADCGTLADGCGGTLDCGTCTDPETCGGSGTANVCGCTPPTCADLGADCGTLADGCGGTLDCGTCTDPETCGGSGTANVCGCTPATCADLGADCGTPADGCGGTLDCGTCTDPETCGGSGTANVCGVPSCTPGTAGCGWEDGDMVTYNQDNWGTEATAASNLLVNFFPTVYPNGVEIGIAGAAGNSAIFTTVEAVLDYQPASGSPAPLDNDLLDPTSTSSGVFGGHVLALQFNVDMSNAGHLSGTSALDFGDLRVCGLTDTPDFNNQTVSQVLGGLNATLGGGSTGGYTYDQLATLAEELNQSFESGSVSLFAQQHVFNGACPCTPGAPGCGWEDGDMVTYNQDNWGGDPGTSTAAASVVTNFDTRYPGGLEVGIPGSAGFSMAFSSAQAVLDYQPGSGTPGPLNADLLDPTSTSSGVFGGHVLALQLNVDFTDSGYVSGTSGLEFGDLRLCGLATTPTFNGMTVRQFLAEMNTALGGGAAAYSYDDLAFLTSDVNSAFESGTASLFAQQHLFNGACPCTPGAPGCGWEDGDMVSYNQDNWGGDPTLITAAALLAAQFGTVYSAFGGFEVGITGAAGFSMLFTSASALLAYEPASGGAAPLNSDLIDPTSSASGVFGGFVVALKLNVDFSDANLINGSTGLKFGDLRICNLVAYPLLNGMTVRQFLATANEALGGGANPYTPDDLAVVSQDLSNAFESGSVSLFAQQHLFNGTCP